MQRKGSNWLLGLGFGWRSHPAGFRESLWVVLGDRAVPETNPEALTCRYCSPTAFGSYFPAPQDYFLYKFPTSSLTDPLLLPAKFGKEQFLGQLCLVGGHTTNPLGISQTRP